MTKQTAETLLNGFVEMAKHDKDPFLIVHFSRQEDKYNGCNDRLTKMEVQIIIAHLMKEFNFNKIDIEICKNLKLQS